MRSTFEVSPKFSILSESAATPTKSTATYSGHNSLARKDQFSWILVYRFPEIEQANKKKERRQ